MKTMVIMVCLLGPLLTRASACTETGKPEPPVFSRPLPSDVAAELDKALAGVKRKHLITPKDTARIRDIVDKVDLKRTEKSLGQLAALGDMGLGVVPVLADLLAQQDDQGRHKAIVSVTVGFLEEKYRHGPYEKTESLVILLLRRSLMDRQSDIRRQAIGSLGAIGWARLRASQPIPAGVSVGLLSALHDPDDALRKAARGTAEDIGVLPRDPSRTIIAN